MYKYLVCYAFEYQEYSEFTKKTYTSKGTGRCVITLPFKIKSVEDVNSAESKLLEFLKTDIKEVTVTGVNLYSFSLLETEVSE